MRRSLAAFVAVLPFVLLALPAPAAGQHHFHFGTIPDFCASPTIQAVSDGRWSSPGTWSPARVPSAGDRVSVPDGRRVTYDAVSNAAIDCLALRGRLDFAAGASTRLTVGTMLVHPSGHLSMGEAGREIGGDAVAEIVIANRPIDRSADPEQWGAGLIVLGRFDARGSARTAFVRLAAEPAAGTTVLALARAVTGWRAGDRVVVPDTRQIAPDNWFNPNYALDHDVRTIASVASDGLSVTLDAPLAHAHAGARDADGTPTVLADGTRLLPHAANLTRSVVIRSQDPSGTRGHVLLTDQAAVDVRGVAFVGLGRTRAAPLDSAPAGGGTNQIGRYPVHFHHLRGPANPTNTGYQYVFVDNVVESSEKWPIAIHGTHFGLVEDNVVYHGMGAGISLENGSETENLIRRNFVADIIGTVNPRNSGPGEANGETPGSGGECIWGAGFNNRFVDNVVSGCRNPNQQIVSGVGFKFITPAALATAKNPKFRGADMTDPGQTIDVAPQRQPLLEFRGNEVYGLAAVGLTTWQLGTDGYAVNDGQGESLVRDFRVWHTYDGAVWNYPATRMTIENLTYRIDPSASRPAAIQSGDYRVTHLTVRGGSIHAGGVFGQTVDPLGVFTFENVRAVTIDHAFSFRTPATPGTRASRPASGVTMVLRNNVVSAWPGEPLRVLEVADDTSLDNYDMSGTYNVFVYDHQGVAGQSFRAYFPSQTNQALYGGQAPCRTSGARPGVDAITCPMTGTPPALPPAPAPSPPTPDTPIGDPPSPDDDGHGPSCGHPRCVGDDAVVHGPARPRGSTASAATAAADVAVRADYDGDGIPDEAVFSPADGTWRIRTSRSGFSDTTTYRWGLDGDVPVPADYDGDGRTDLAVFRPGAGTWHVLSSSTGWRVGTQHLFGDGGDVPVPADYDGDGRADLAVFHPGSGRWLVLPSSAAFAEIISQTLGGPGDVPAPVDVDGDGRADFRIYRPATGEWLVVSSSGRRGAVR